MGKIILNPNSSGQLILPSLDVLSCNIWWLNMNEKEENLEY